MIARLYERVVPAEALADIGFVHWVIADPEPPLPEDAVVASGGLCVPFTVLNLWPGVPPNWRRWPEYRVRDVLPTFSASRGGIRYEETTGA